MNSGGLGFRDTVLAGLVVAILSPVILTGVSWLFGFHHQAWLAAVAVIHWIGDALTYSVPVSVVVVVMALGGFALYGWRGAARRKRADLAAMVKPHAIAAAAELPQLTDNEVKVVRLLAWADGKSIGHADLIFRVAVSSLVIDQTLERLRARNFLNVTFDKNLQPAYYLTSAGRDYAIAAGYVRRPVAARVAHFVR